jgi:hypothetical protein
MGLGQLEILASAGGIDVPVTTSLITLASSLMNTEYREIAEKESPVFGLSKQEIIDKIYN